jgi:hypothetical protein
MVFLRCLIGGAVGGLIGLAIWTAVAHWTGFEVGYIAWGVGFLTGFGVRAMAGERQNPAFGVLAVLIALASIVGAKYLVVCLQFSGLNDMALDDQPDSQDVYIAAVATEVAGEFEKAGRKVDWPPEEELEGEKELEAARANSEVWREAAERWKAMPPEKQQAQIEESKRQTAELMAELNSTIRTAVFRASFSAFDLLWLALAALTAFRLGSGASSES